MGKKEYCQECGKRLTNYDLYEGICSNCAEVLQKKFAKNKSKKKMRSLS